MQRLSILLIKLYLKLFDNLGELGYEVLRPRLLLNAQLQQLLQVNSFLAQGFKLRALVHTPFALSLQLRAELLLKLCDRLSCCLSLLEHLPLHRLLSCQARLLNFLS
jgi:hypothetical protein